MRELQYSAASNLFCCPIDNAEYRKECGIRAGAESLMDGLANTHAGRQSRHRREKGSRLQAVFAGISCNVKRFIRFSTGNCVKKTCECSDLK